MFVTLAHWERIRICPTGWILLSYHKVHKMKVKVAQSCWTLCNPMEYRVHGILQARILEWVTFPFFRGSSQPRDQTQVSPSLQEDSLPAEPPVKYCEVHKGKLKLLKRSYTWKQNCAIGEDDCPYYNFKLYFSWSAPQFLSGLSLELTHSFNSVHHCPFCLC